MEKFLEKNYNYWWFYAFAFTTVILLLQTINSYAIFLSYFLIPMYLGILLSNENITLHLKNLSFVIITIFISVLLFGKMAQFLAPIIAIILITFLKVEKRVLGFAFASILIYNLLSLIIMVLILKFAEYLEGIASLMMIYPLVSILIYSLLCQNYYKKRVLKT